MRYREDPAVAAAARSEAAEMHTELASRYAAGEHYWTAREAVIAKHGPRIARECGKETARRALAAITALGPEDMPKEARHASRDHLLHDIEQAYCDLHGPGYRYSPFERWWWRVTGTLWRAHPRMPRGCQEKRLAGPELVAWKAKASQRRLEEARAEMARQDAEAERIARERAEERELEAFLVRHRRRLERGDVPRDVPAEERDVQAFLRGERSLTHRPNPSRPYGAVGE